MGDAITSKKLSVRHIIKEDFKKWLPTIGRKMDHKKVRGWNHRYLLKRQTYDATRYWKYRLRNFYKIIARCWKIMNDTFFASVEGKVTSSNIEKSCANFCITKLETWN